MSELHLERPELLWWLLLLAPMLALAAWRSRADTGKRGQVAALVLRCLFMALCITAVAGPVAVKTKTQPAAAKVVLLTDGSQSVTRGGDEAQQRAKQIRAALGNDVEVVGLNFAGGVWDSGEKPGEIDQTDIEAALNAANARSLESADCRVILISDGRSTRGDAVEAASRLAMRGGSVWTIPVGRHEARPLQLVRLEPPVDARLGGQAAVRVTVAAEKQVRAKVRLLDPDGKAVDERAIPVEGEKTVVLRFTPSEQGMRMYSAEVVPDPPALGSAGGENRRAPIFVAGPPRILIADNFKEEVAALFKALEELKIPIDVVRPEEWPADLSQYAAIIISDFSGKELTDKERISLRRHVEELGAGLVFIGGGNVLATRWKENPLAEVLPVILQERPTELVKKQPQASVCFVLDRSGSMGSSMGGGAGLMKLDIVKAATIASIQVLPDNTQIAVVAFDSRPTLVVPPTDISKKTEISEKVDRIGSGGGTEMAPAVREGLQQLSNMPGDKYLIVLTDGRSQPSNWDQLISEAKAVGVSWTSIAIGTGADVDLMSYLAKEMRGKFHFCETGDKIPKVFLEEARAIKRITDVTQKPFRPKAGPAAAKIKDLAVADMPELQGRVSAKPREQIDTLLLGPNDEPLLSVWQFGVGRVIAFTSDAKAAWGKDWAGWKGYAPFWLQVVQSVMRSQNELHVKVRSQVQGKTATFVYTVVDEKGRPASDLRCKGELLSAKDAETAAKDGSAAAKNAPAAKPPATVRWRQLGPGMYQATADLPPGKEPWVASMTLGKENSRPIHYSALVSAQEGAELAQTGADLSALRAIAEAGGGSCTDQIEKVASACRVREQRTIARQTPLWPWLIMTALLLWPVDLLIRKFL